MLSKYMRKKAAKSASQNSKLFALAASLAYYQKHLQQWQREI